MADIEKPEGAAAGGEGGSAVLNGGGDPPAAGGDDKAKAGEGEGKKPDNAPPAGGEGGDQKPAAGGDGGDQKPPAKADGDDGDDGEDEGGEDWRSKLAGGDEKVAKELARYNSLADVAKALVEAKGKLRERNLGPRPLPKDATPEQVKEWKEAHGVPEDGAGYGVELDDDLEDAARSNYEAFLDRAAARNLPASAVKEAVAIYQEIEAEAIDRVVEGDLAAEAEVRSELTEEWGGRVEFKRNVAMAENFLQSLPGGIGATLMQSRDADGRKLGNNVEVIKWIAGMARNHGFADDFVPDANGGDVSGRVSIDARLEEIKKTMADGSYWKDKNLQDEYGRLLQARERRDSRGGKAA